MSILKLSGWRWVGRIFGGIFTFVTLLYLVVFVFALIAAAVGAFFEGVGAAPGLAAASDIFFMYIIFLLYALLALLIIYVLLVPLDALINVIIRAIFGGEGSFVEDANNGWDGFGEGLLDGFKFVIRSLARAAKEWSFIEYVPIIGPFISGLAMGPAVTKPCPSSMTIQLARTETHRERDYPFGKSGAEVEQDAIKGAEDDASEAAENAVSAEGGRIACQSPCRKRVSSRSVRLDGQTTVTVSYGRVWDTYEATATAIATAVVECV